MLEFKEALRAVLSNAKTLTEESVSIDDSVKRVLAEDLYSGIDMPPFNKSAMDGYAVNARDIRRIPARLECVGFIQAGEVFRKKIGREECVKIMTGAALPDGTDTVVMVEDSKSCGRYVDILKSAERHKNVCFRGEDIKRGRRVLKKGKRITASDVALMAAIGRRFIKAVRQPKTAVLNTGGEIVAPGKRLKKKSIYNSNGPQLSALLKTDGFTSDFLGIAQDRPKELREAVRKGLKSDVLLISGGVSMGDYDIVPAVLEKAGIKKILHKVNIKPGKPLFFGTGKDTIVFGIPGNPVSNFLAYNVFIRPALYKMSGIKRCGPVFKEGIVDRTFRHKTGRKHFVLAKKALKGGDYYITPVIGHGSADILALSKADSFMVVDAFRCTVEAGSKIRFITWS